MTTATITASLRFPRLHNLLNKIFYHGKSVGDIVQFSLNGFECLPLIHYLMCL